MIILQLEENFSFPISDPYFRLGFKNKGVSRGFCGREALNREDCNGNKRLCRPFLPSLANKTNVCAYEYKRQKESEMNYVKLRIKVLYYMCVYTESLT